MITAANITKWKFHQISGTSENQGQSATSVPVAVAAPGDIRRQMITFLGCTSHCTMADGPICHLPGNQGTTTEVTTGVVGNLRALVVADESGPEQGSVLEPTL